MPAASSRQMLHVDMDAFFAAVEQREQPELRGRPVVVGAPPNARGVVSTCSYEARAFGIHSAMPSRTAYKRCPHAVFLPVRGKLYKQVSEAVMEIFHRFTPLVEPLSIDEAFLDITGSHHLFGGPRALAQRLKDTIHEEQRLTASVGLAPNKFLAKLASDMDKPDGLTVVPREPATIRDWLAPLPVTRIWGVGKRTAEHLHRAGLEQVRDLQQLSCEQLQDLLGNAGGARIHALARGEDEREIALEHEDKSISHEHTFKHDTRDWDEIEHTLLKLAEKVGRRVRADGRLPRTAHLKLRWASFKTITRQRPLTPPTAADHDLIAAALDLLRRERCNRAVRLVGFGVTNFTDADNALYQPDLFEDTPDYGRERNTDLDDAVDRIRDQFGDDSLYRGGR